MTDSETGTMACLRCGTCCRKYQAIVSDEEVQTVADYLGITFDEWVRLYAEPRWQSTINHLIRHNEGACIFLKDENDFTSCVIHAARPACCSDWLPGEDKPECREGLTKYSV